VALSRDERAIDQQRIVGDPARGATVRRHGRWFAPSAAWRAISAVRRDRLARDDIHPVSSDLGDLGVAIALDWQLR